MASQIVSLRAATVTLPGLVDCIARCLSSERPALVHAACKTVMVLAEACPQAQVRGQDTQLHADRKARQARAGRAQREGTNLFVHGLRRRVNSALNVYFFSSLCTRRPHALLAPDTDILCGSVQRLVYG